MTILCAATKRLPGVMPCTHLGQHRVTCHDHPGWAQNPGLCRGCLPRKADRGFLCHSHYERVMDAHEKWRPFVRLLIETDGRAVSGDGGGIKGATPDGYTPLPLTFLALDECERHLRSLTGRTLDAWVHTEDGAADALQFAAAAERAYRSVEVEKRELRLERVRCPHCGQLTLTGNTTRRHYGSTIVECQNCGAELDKIRDDTSRWVGTEACENADHDVCSSLNCRCSCHELGRPSQVVGVGALWDADMHAAAPSAAPREEWTIDDPHTIRHTPTEERRSA